MLSVYLEPSFINRAVDANRSGQDVTDALRSRNSRPVVGLHAIYDLARTLLTAHNEERAHRLFTLVAQIGPTFYWYPDELLNRELEKLRHRTAVLPFLDHENHLRTVSEINRLSQGVLSDEGRSFIQGRESDIAATFPSSSAQYIKQIAQVRASQPNLMPKGRQFEDVITYFRPQFPQIVAAILHPRAVTPSECTRLSENLDEYPSLRAAVRANLYMCFIMIVHGATPGDDKLDDYRHVIEAAYCDAILTADKQLERTATRITPQITVIPFDTLGGAGAAA